jgi:hypothetical protein
MTRYLACPTIFLALAVGLVAFAQDPTKESPYFPLKKGTTWTYKRILLRKAEGTPITVQVTDSDKDGTRLGTFGKDRENKDKDKLLASETVVVTDDGVYRTAINGIKPDAPVCFLKLPAKKGDKWDVDTKIEGQVVKGTFTTDEEEVTVPAGKYKTIKVEAKDFNIGGTQATIVCWYAEKVGIVKRSYRVGKREFVHELEKFAEGK